MSRRHEHVPQRSRREPFKARLGDAKNAPIITLSVRRERAQRQLSKLRQTYGRENVTLLLPKWAEEENAAVEQVIAPLHPQRTPMTGSLWGDK